MGALPPSRGLLERLHLGRDSTTSRKTPVRPLPSGAKSAFAQISPNQKTSVSRASPLANLLQSKQGETFAIEFAERWLRGSQYLARSKITRRACIIGGPAE